MVISAIIFDMDGVVIDSENIADIANEQFFTRRNVIYDRSIKPQLTGRSLREGTQRLIEIYGFSGDTNDLTRERLDDRLRLYRDSLEFISGFEEFHSSLNEREMVSCIATSSHQDLLKAADERLGLSAKFSGRVYASSIIKCRTKPAPDLFLYAAKMLDLLPERCVVIEDSPLGIDAAKAAGMRVVGLATTYTCNLLAHATTVVEKFSDIDLNSLD